MRAQDIVDQIMGSERYARSFGDRVYRDEPILRTGAQAFRSRGDRPQAAQTPRAAQTPAAQASRTTQAPARAVPYRREEPMPERYRKMRRLARGSTSWGGRYTGGGSRLFFEQGKFMEDFEDDYAAEGVDFAMYYPTYEEMSDRQLRSYFTWRTRLRAGEAPSAPTSFLFVHAYEILCGIGVEAGEAGFAELQRFREQYAGASAGFDVHLARWSHDYVIDHGLDASLLVVQKGTFDVEAVATLRQAEAALLARTGDMSWPERVGEGWPSEEQLLDALVALSRYRADRSRFFRDHRAEVAEVACRVFARMVAHCRKRRKTDLVDGLFGVPTRMSYTLYPSALYWSPTVHDDVTYAASASETYECERGFWWRVLPCRKTETSRELGGLLHAIDARMRAAFGDHHALKEKSLPKYQGKFIDEEIEALMARRAAAEAARIHIDRSSLSHIRSASVRTREALLTDEEREAELPVPMACAPVVSAAPEPAMGLTAEQMSLLAALLDGREPTGDEMFFTLATDAINEAFLDVIGDTVLDCDGGVPTLVEDYVDDVRVAIGA